ncbi:MAG: HDIG domain-containing metalloprotein [Elusimicrobiota bacterium]
MNREQALNLVKEKVDTQNLIKHMLATEACMEELARYFNEEEEEWGLAGLLHDVDYEQTKDDPERHGLRSAEILEDKEVDIRIIEAIKAHAGKKEPENKLEKALYAVDPLTGLIVAAALMHPDKELKSTDTDFVLRRFGEKRFAAGADRDQIRSCENLGMELEKFVDISLKAMQDIDDKLGL